MEDAFVSEQNFSDEVRRNMRLPKEVRVFDTTLRDGEQTPGVSLTPKDKLAIAFALEELGLDSIEAGFPISSKGEAEAIKQISEAVTRSEIAGLARTVDADIDAAINAGVGCVHTFIGTSDIHLRYKLKMTQEQVTEKAASAIKRAKSAGVKVEFSAEDATRTSPGFLNRIFKAAVEAGADRVNVPDTVGVMLPAAMKSLIAQLDLPVPISVHCHNDFGLAVPNSLAAVEAGASQVHVCVNGLGERAGNADLAQIAMSLRALYRIGTRIDSTKLYSTSKMVSRLTKIRLPPNYPLVGDNAFAHESGIHVHGVLGNASTYEALTPESVGQKRAIVLGKHTGAHAVADKLAVMNVSATEQQLKEIVQRVKLLGDAGRRVTDREFGAIVEAITGALPKEEKAYKLIDVNVASGNNLQPTARLTLSVNGTELTASAAGVGPVDAVAKAMEKLTGNAIRLSDYRLEAITGGTDALADVEITLEDPGGRKYTARAVNQDIVMASVEAMIEGLNKARLKAK